ncbi:MAG: type II CAAX endopeptidase family protein [Myxococcota bacterium]
MLEEVPDREPGGDRDDTDPGGARPDRAGFVRGALLFYGMLGCVALVWRMATPGESILHPSGRPASFDGLGGALIAGLVFGLVSLGISEALSRFSTLGEALSDALGESVAGISVGDGILLAFASGIAEEMFFRGALQPAIGLVWASLLFGACHFLPKKELAVWSVWAAAMGFAFGWLFEATGHLVAPIAAHVLVNAVNLPRLARRAEERAAAARSD